jgi:hypothetical protein
MWAFLSARLRMWLIVVVVAPLLGWLLGKIGDLIESRRGPNGLSKVLQMGRDWLRKRSKGPLAVRRAAETGVPQDPAAPPR